MLHATILYAGVLAMAADPGPMLPGDRSSSPASAHPLTLAALAMPGDACSHDAECRDAKCGTSWDGQKYCVLAARACALQGHPGASVGGRVSRQDRCYRCTRGTGWEPC